MRDGAELQSSEIVYGFERLELLAGWWWWAVLIAGITAVVWLSMRLYRRDTAELPTALGLSMMFLRLSVIALLVFFFFGLERRARQRVTRPSEVAILVDTSQSMSLPASDQAGAPSRMETVASLLGQTPLLETLSDDHRITVYGFDAGAELQPLHVTSLRSQASENARPAMASTQADAGPAVSSLAIAGAVAVAAALLALVIAVALRVVGRPEAVPPLVLSAAVLMVAGGIALAIPWTRYTESSLAALLGIEEQVAGETADEEGPPSPEEEEDREPTDWEATLVASGTQTRIGDAVRLTLLRHDPSTLAAIVLMTDGQNNGGVATASAAALAARAGVPIYPLGLGSSQPPINVRLVDLDAPRRVYPGDRFTLSGTLQASGPRPQRVQVQLLDGSDSAELPSEVVDSREVEVPADGTLVGVRFEMEPEEVGTRRLAMRVVPPPGDTNPDDDLRDARYEVVARRLRVMLIAGGPMREYQFVRNLLFRDNSIEVDAWLQTGQPGISQDADRLLSDFPKTAEELFEYDAIVAFDPDWMMLDAAQIELLDRWLNQQAGGLVLVSGPVQLPRWSRIRSDSRVNTLKGIYPVVLTGRDALLDGGRQGGETPWPLQFTADAQRSEFLWLTDDAASSFEAWEEFGGVFDFVGAKTPKPGARVYAHFSDPTTAIDNQLPIYLASHFYGAGRVFFQGSGEMWRLRGVSDALFDAYYTKLVRWASEGRLLRDSNRGILLVDQPRTMVGETITVRAILTDEQFQPLEVPRVDAELLAPGGRIERVRLTPQEGQPRSGTYGGRVLVRDAGAYELRLTLGDALNEHVLRQTFQARLPTLELERPQRNDEAMLEMASLSGGRYLAPGSPESTSPEDDNPLVLAGWIEPQPQTTILPGTPDRDFHRRRNASLLWLIAAALSLEWVIRRLHRLA